AHHSAWTTSLFSGQPAETRVHSDEGCRLYDPERHRSHKYLYGGHDPGVCARTTAGLAAWMLGYPNRALASMNEAIALAEQIGHPVSLNIALGYAVIFPFQHRETSLVTAHVMAAETVKREQRVSTVFPPDFLAGAMFLAQGAYADAIASIRSGLEPGRPGTILWRPFAFCVLAQALTMRNAHAETLEALGTGVARLEANGERLWEVELHRTEGLVLQA